MVLHEPSFGPWERVIIDLVSPLPLTRNQNLYALIAVDPIRVTS